MGEIKDGLIELALEPNAAIEKADESGHSTEQVINVPQLLGTVKVRKSDALPSSETHYVLVIHGTFSKPKKDSCGSWFLPCKKKTPASDRFCEHLSVRLAAGDLGAEAVWRKLPDAHLLPSGVRYPFYWDGTNTDQGRKDGAWYLSKLIRHIADRDPSARIHLIAHSHGGNVTLKAVEIYIQRLGVADTEADWSDAVQEQFRTEHQAPSDEIERWRLPEGVGIWGWLFPFLVVKRGEKGEKGSHELYPWAYHRCVDSLLRLGKSRKNRYLSNRRMTSPISNALGKIIFLGTPFYNKQWARYAAMRVFFSFLVSLVSGFLLTFIAIGIWAGVFGLRVPHDITFYIAAGLTLLIFCFNLAGFSERTLFRNGNMYHSDLVPWSPAMHALCIQAGKLDEAALALSAEPAALAFLLPLVRKATARVGFVAPPRAPRPGARALAWLLFCLATLRMVLLNAVLLVPRVLFWLVSKAIVKHTFSTVRKIVVGLAFGLDTANLEKANVFVEETLVLQGGPRNIYSWDVRKLLADVESRGLTRTWTDDFSCEGAASTSQASERREESGLLPNNCSGKLNDAPSEEKSESKSSEESAQGAQELGVRESVPSKELSGSKSSRPIEENGIAEQELGVTGNAVSKELSRGNSSRRIGEADPTRQELGVAENAASDQVSGSNSSRRIEENDVTAQELGVEENEVDWMSQCSSYSFLWDDESLRTLSDASFMYSRLKRHVPKMAHNPRLTHEQFARELRITCCIVEARFWEIRSQWQLTHATYYRNQEIVEAMARFLNSSELPTELK